MKAHMFKGVDLAFMKKFAKAEKAIFSALGMKPTKKWKDGFEQVEVAANPVYRFTEAKAKDKKIDEGMDRLVDSFVKEIKACNPKHVSEMEVYPDHEPKRLRLGYVVVFTIDRVNGKPTNDGPVVIRARGGCPPQWVTS